MHFALFFGRQNTRVLAKRTERTRQTRWRRDLVLDHARHVSIYITKNKRPFHLKACGHYTTRINENWGHRWARAAATCPREKRSRNKRYGIHLDLYISHSHSFAFLFQDTEVSISQKWKQGLFLFHSLCPTIDTYLVLPQGTCRKKIKVRTHFDVEQSNCSVFTNLLSLTGPQVFFCRQSIRGRLERFEIRAAWTIVPVAHGATTMTYIIGHTRVGHLRLRSFESYKTMTSNR